MNLPSLQAYFPARRPLLLHGAVLLEVVLALLLFVAAAAVISGGLSSSTHTVERLRLQTHAGNLAASFLAEVQLGLHPIVSAGPTPFDPPFEDWTWELIPATISPFSAESTRFPLQQVEVIIRNLKEPVVFRMAQTLALDTILKPTEALDTRDSTSDISAALFTPGPVTSMGEDLP